MKTSKYINLQYIYENVDFSQKSGFNKILIISVGLHIFFILLITILTISGKKEFYNFMVDIVTPSEIGIPTEPVSTIEEQNTDKNRNQSNYITESDKISFSKEVKKVSKVIERLYAIKKFETIKELKEKDGGVFVSVGKKSDFISSGLTADASKTTKKGNTNYYTIISKKIWEQWSYPDFKGSNFETIISIKIDINGNIYFWKIEKSSGNVLFDQSVIKAILKASPLPAPSVEMEVGIRFYL